MDASDHTADVLVERGRSLDEWVAVVRQRFVTLQIAPQSSSDVAGVVRTRHIGHLQASAVCSTPQTFTRTKRMAATGDCELFALGLVDRGTGYLEQDGRTCAVSNGSFAIYETDRPFSWSLTGDWRIFVFTWPRDSVAFSSLEMRKLTAATVPGTTGVGSMVSPLLRGLLPVGAGISLAGAARFASEIAELSVIAAGENCREPVDVDAGRGQLREIQTFIEQHLTDPALTPPAIAREFHMSTRTLHRLFALHGLTVAAWIKDRRLEGARRALVASGSSVLPVHQIAARYGFSTVALFSRSFATRYGQSPSTYRAIARR